MEVDPTRMLELLVGLPAVRVFGVADLLPSAPLVQHVETRLSGAPDCPGCGGPGRPVLIVEHHPVHLATRLSGLGLSAGRRRRRPRWWVAGIGC